MINSCLSVRENEKEINMIDFEKNNSTCIAYIILMQFYSKYNKSVFTER